MDSISQLVLGAAVGGAVLGDRAGAKALLWGGLIATLPDLDVLVPLGDAVSRFTYHRSASHSLFVLTLVTPLLAWLILRLHPGQRVHWRQWLWLVWLALTTHVLLDCFTIYGTQTFWPLWPYPIGWGSVFIIDPLYTLPLLIVVSAAPWLRRRPERLRHWAIVGLAVSTAYLAWGVGAQRYVDRLARASLAAQGIPQQKVLALPTPFNTLLWRLLAMAEDGYYEGYYSLLDGSRSLRFRRYPSSPELIEPLRESFAVRRLAWFTKGYYRVLARGEAITMTDLRMGLEPAYVFSFVVGERRDGRIVPVPNRPDPIPALGPSALPHLGTRILEGPEYRMDF